MRIGGIYSIAMLVLMLGGCGGDDSEIIPQVDQVVGETGRIDTSDPVNLDYANLHYDAFRFDASGMDQVRIEVVTEEFAPLVHLIEVSTGAVLAEWDAEWSHEPALLYTVPVRGIYEARVYAMNGGTGEYAISVDLNPEIEP